MASIYGAFFQMSPLYVFISPKVVHTLPRCSVYYNLHAHHLHGHELHGSLPERFGVTVGETPS